MNESLYDAELAYLSEFLQSDDDDWHPEFSHSFQEEEEEEEEDEELLYDLIAATQEKEKTLEEKLEDFRKEWSREIVKRDTLLLDEEEEENNRDRRFHIDVMEKIAPLLVLNDLYQLLAANHYFQGLKNDLLTQLRVIKLRKLEHLKEFRFGIFTFVESYTIKIDALNFPPIPKPSIGRRDLIKLGENIRSIEITLSTRHPLSYLTTHYNLTNVVLFLIYRPDITVEQDEEKIASDLARGATSLYFNLQYESAVQLNKAKETHVKIGEKIYSFNNVVTL